MLHWDMLHVFQTPKHIAGMLYYSLDLRCIYDVKHFMSQYVLYLSSYYRTWHRAMHVCMLTPTCIFFPNGSTAPWGPRPPHYRGFTITHFRHTTVGRTPLDEWPARRRDLYLTTHNTHKRKTSMPPVGFEPAIPASERPQTHALDRAATGITLSKLLSTNVFTIYIIH
jgi:hypothetical protein